MKLCDICETENETFVDTCILCGGELAEEVTNPTQPELLAVSEPDPAHPSPDPVQDPVVDPQQVPGNAPIFPTTPMETQSPDAGFHAPPGSHAPTAIPPTQPSGQLMPGSYADSQAGGQTLGQQNTISQFSEPPPPGTLCLIVYFQRQPALYVPIVYDEMLIGRNDPASNAYPDIDLTPFDPELAISRKHAYLYREGDAYYIYPISNSGTQVNQEMVDIGVKKRLKENDVLILSGRLAIRFAHT